MSTKENKEAVVEVLTKEQIEKFPKDIRANIETLSTGSRPGELAEFNPLVSGLLELKEIVSKLELKPAGEDGKFDKENIQEFTDAKKSIRSYNGNLGRVAKALKAPRIAENKALKAIEDTFKNESKSLMEKAEEIFKPYVDAEEERKRIAQEKKDAALNAKMEEQNKIIEEQKLKQKISETVNKIKYDLIAEQITNKSNDIIVNGNESLIQSFYNGLDVSFEDFVSGYDLSIIDNDIVFELKTAHAKAVNNARAVVNQKLEAIRIEKENEALKLKEELKKQFEEEHKEKVSNTQTLPTPPVTPMPIPSSVPPPPEMYSEEDLFKDLMDIHSKVKKYVELGMALSNDTKTVINKIYQLAQ